MSSDRYAVIGNPIAHSRSPAIHRLFAQQTGEAIEYERLLAPLDGFAGTVRAFVDQGGRGANVTVPFKIEAWRLADRRSLRAEAAGAANVLVFDQQGCLADNTDGAGLVRDISDRLGIDLRGARVLLLGAGGAARGVIRPILEAGAARLHIANRSPERARQLAADFDEAAPGRLSAGDLVQPPEGFELVINATSAGLSEPDSPMAAAALAGSLLAYDMVYGAAATPFMRAASAAGVPQVSDGLGMLVEQAAESFLIWRGIRPDTRPVYQAIRDALQGSRKDSLP
jgi:shikimate dehydrogenase